MPGETVTVQVTLHHKKWYVLIRWLLRFILFLCEVAQALVERVLIASTIAEIRPVKPKEE